MEQKTTTDANDKLGIVSVNTRASALQNTAGKLVFVVVVGSVLVIGLLMAMNSWRATRTADAAQEEHAAKVENTPAQVGPKRIFDQDPLYQPHRRASTNGKGQSHAASLTPGVEQGLHANGRPIQGTGRERPVGTAQPSRYGGEAILAGTHQPTGPSTQHRPDAGAEAAMTLVRDLLGSPRGAESTDPAGAMFGGTSAIPVGMGLPTGDPSSAAFDPEQAGQLGGVGLPFPPGPAASGAGSIGGLLTPSSTPKVQAGLIGDRNMILPKGKSIDCALTIRVINA